MILGIFLFCLALGGILIAASIFLGDHDSDAHADMDGDADVDADMDADADVDADADADVDADADADAGGDHHVDTDTWLPFLSLRFWTFSLASFGLTGTLLKVVRFGDMLSVAIAVPTGLAIGLAAAWLFRSLKKDSIGSTPDTHDLSGSEAEVVLDIGPDKMGKIRLRQGGHNIELPATTQEAKLLERKTRVLVVAVVDGTADVIGLSPAATPKGT